MEPITAGAKSSQSKLDIPASYYYDKKLSEKSISFLTRRMFMIFNHEHIVAKRRKNFNLLLAQLPQYRSVEPLLRNFQMEYAL